MRLKECRRAARLKQREAAVRLGVTQGAISQWETGTCSPRLDMLLLMAKIYGCGLYDLVGEADREDESSGEE